MKDFLKVGLFVFLLISALCQAAADKITGVVVDKRKNNLDVDVYIRVDEKRPYDYIIRLVRVNSSYYPGRGLNMTIENGTIITFDDDGMEQRGPAKYGDQRRIIYINDTFVLDMFPLEPLAAFPYAQAEAKRTRE